MCSIKPWQAHWNNLHPKPLPDIRVHPSPHPGICTFSHVQPNHRTKFRRMIILRQYFVQLAATGLVSLKPPKSALLSRSPTNIAACLEATAQIQIQCLRHLAHKKTKHKMNEHRKPGFQVRTVFLRIINKITHAYCIHTYKYICDYNRLYIVYRLKHAIKIANKRCVFSSGTGESEDTTPKEKSLTIDIGGTSLSGIKQAPCSSVMI